MAYALRSFHAPDEHNIGQWANRTVEGELKSCDGRTLVSIFDRYLPPPPARIIEAGCGLGGWVLWFRQKGYEVVGIENQVAIVGQVKAQFPDAPIFLGDILHLDFPEGSFDAYVSLGVIEHFEEGPEAALTEAYRVLKPGGLAFITVPYLSPLRRLWSHPLRDLFFLLRRRLKKAEDRFWEYRYSKKELAHFLNRVGFEILEVGIDDYEPADRKHHIGLYADFFFLRKKGGEIWELNLPGRLFLRFGRIFSPWFFCSGLHMIARKPSS